jgi:hypothetical protein
MPLRLLRGAMIGVRAVPVEGVMRGVWRSWRPGYALRLLLRYRQDYLLDMNRTITIQYIGGGSAQAVLFFDKWIQVLMSARSCSLDIKCTAGAAQSRERSKQGVIACGQVGRVPR